MNGIQQLYNDRHMEYDDAGGVGNISSITGTGSGFNYGENGAGPHALTSVSRPEPAWRPGPQEIKYTSFNKVSSIVDTVATGKTLSYDIYYGLDNQRRKSVFKDSGQVMRTKHYFGDYEIIQENSEIKNYHYISSPTGLCAIFVTDDQDSLNQLWHTYTDHLGSLVYMVNADNENDFMEYSYDAWGNPRDAEDWTDSLSIPLFAGRGFTGHEHLEEIALINMNGRIYDPMLGRFFSPDPYVQFPGYAGSYNRYSYCLNNPLKYVDPSGLKVEFKQDPRGGSGGGFSIDAFFKEMQAMFNPGGLNKWRNTHSGLPGRGINGPGLNGVYYDWYSRTYRSTSDYNEVGWAYAFHNIMCSNAVSEIIYTRMDDGGSLFRGLHFGRGGSWYTQYGWDVLLNMVMGLPQARNSGGSWASQVDWGGVSNSFLNILGGIGEMIVGGVGTYILAGTSSSTSVPLIVDGGYRVLANIPRLTGYLTLNTQFANSMPGNIGSTLGKGIDIALGVPANHYGTGQGIGGATNDFASFLVTGGTAAPLKNMLTNPSFGNGVWYFSAYGGYINSTYNNLYPLKKY